MMKVGLVLHTWALQEGEEPHYNTIRTAAQWVEAAGFDSLWLYDHVLFRSPGWPEGGMWECWTVLSALAEVTHRVELGPLVLCNGFRNPALVAKMATTLDEVSDGRLILGLGAGWNDVEFAALGVPFDHPGGSLRGGGPDPLPAAAAWASRLCRLLLCGARRREQATWTAPGGTATPDRGRGQSHAATRRALCRSVEYRLPGMPESLVEPKASLHTACADVGRDPTTIAVTVLVGVGYPEETTVPPRFGTAGFVTGSARELCTVLRGYAQLGVQHVIFDCAPDTAAVRARVAEGLRLFQAGESVQP
jgi:alkanesulfonate monooxygenase SsuD/methylene tetrahydromethanopterin reductase-like flavin-dependent oxidoreductase (luciferase family)